MISVSRIATASVTRRPKHTGYKTLFLASALLFIGACNDDTPADPVVIGSIAVTPRLSTARVGSTQQLEAAAFSPSGAPMPGETFVWSSSEKSVATVTESGLVTFVGSGSTAILAKARGFSGFATIVSEANVASVTITAPDPVIQKGQTQMIYATPLDANGVSQFRPVTWTSSAPTVATVNDRGEVSGISPGTATITATSEGKSASVVFTILPPAPVATITLTPTEGTIKIGAKYTLTSELLDKDGAVLNRVITWTTSNSAIATVSADGEITGVSEGIVTITGTSEGKSASVTFAVSQYTGLISGETQTFNGPTAGQSIYFAVYVPAGATSLNVILRDGGGDPDMYVYAPGASSETCKSETGGSTVKEDCTIANPVAGVWVVEVYTYAVHTGTKITATVSK